MSSANREKPELLRSPQARPKHVPSGHRSSRSLRPCFVSHQHANLGNQIFMGHPTTMVSKCVTPETECATFLAEQRCNGSIHVDATIVMWQRLAQTGKR
jgi:hypothetical protein